jgi:curved DNA-binding protein
MTAPAPSMTAAQARQVLGLGVLAEAGEVRLAFREAAKAAHPDRDGGDPERFRAIVDAYRLLQAQRPPERLHQPPSVVRDEGEATLSISPLLALEGGSLEHRLADGRRVKLTLPAGLRTGDRVRAAGAQLTVAIRRDGETLVRGDDIWITVDLDPRRLAEGGRIALETPLGRRLVWVTRKAGERGLVRLVGQGLPARGGHRAGHLFLRLKPLTRTTDSVARTLLRRFAAAWAA